MNAREPMTHRDKKQNSHEIHEMMLNDAKVNVVDKMMLK